MIYCMINYCFRDQATEYQIIVIFDVNLSITLVFLTLLRIKLDFLRSSGDEANGQS